MRLMKKTMAIALVAAMVATLAPANVADAAKKVKLSTKSKTLEVKKTFKLKVKNAKKSAKVTWKTSKKKVAKIKKSTKKGNASATILGVKKGNAVISAIIKQGKKKTTLKCKVKVVKAKAPVVTQAPATQAPATQAPATQAPTTTVPAETTKPSGTPKPTRTPKPTPTPSPTPMPDKEFKFPEVASGVAIDVSSYEKIGNGTGGYNKDTGRVEINDSSSADGSQGAWALPADYLGDFTEGSLVTFRIQGFNYGTSGFRFWVGGTGSASSTPILLNNEIDEELKVGDYPAAFDADGNELSGLASQEDINAKIDTTKNQMKLELDPDTKAFDITFTFKVGTSQFQVNPVTHLTLKNIMSGDTVGFINGLCIKNIYYIPSGSAGEVTGPAIDVTGPAVDVTTSSVEVSLADITLEDKTLKKTINDDGSVTFANGGKDFSGIIIPLDKEIAIGEKVLIDVEYAFEGGSKATKTGRLYLTPAADSGTGISNNIQPGQPDVDVASATQLKGTLTVATTKKDNGNDVPQTDPAKAFMIKADAWDTNFKSLTVKKITVTYFE